MTGTTRKLRAAVHKFNWRALYATAREIVTQLSVMIEVFVRTVIPDTGCPFSVRTLRSIVDDSRSLDQACSRGGVAVVGRKCR